MSTVETVRDISIIVLAVQTIVVQVILVLLLLEIRSLSKMLRENISPILQSADETARTVRGTSTFVSDTVVAPGTSSAFAAGVTEAIRILARRGNKIDSDLTPNDYSWGTTTVGQQIKLATRYMLHIGKEKKK